MLNQSKSVYQAEIDAACELIDFYRFNPAFMGRSMQINPQAGTELELRRVPLRSKGLCLPLPLSISLRPGESGHRTGDDGQCRSVEASLDGPALSLLCHEAARGCRLPAGVINFLPGRGNDIGEPVLNSSEFAGMFFTGSNSTFNTLWGTLSRNVSRYRSYPRVVGETGGKDFVFAHASADVQELATALVRGAFEYQGQKCSAASRAYIPRSLWPRVQDRMLAQIAEIRTGDPLDFRNFMNAVIDRNSFNNIMSYFRFAQESPETRILCGGEGDSSKGFFCPPDGYLDRKSRTRLMTEEIFGPVLTVFVYDDNRFDETLEICDTSTAYALTGSVFCADRLVITKMANACGIRPETSISTTSLPGLSSASSLLAAGALRGPTTKWARPSA